MISMSTITQNDDKARLSTLDKNKLLDLFFVQIKNIWRVDGLYFQGIEKNFGVNNATEIDKNTWELLGKIEAKDLKNLFGYNSIDNIRSLMELLLNTSWALYQEEKKYNIDEEKNIGEFYIVRCKVQEARIKKGLGIFPCKNVRLNYLKSFIKELNIKFDVEVISCPPDEKRPDYWCGWRFKLIK